MLIFEQSRPGRRDPAQSPQQMADVSDLPADMLREDVPGLPEVSEMQAVRHYTRLSQKNFSIDTQFYPLGSCTMKYNPRACNSLAMLPGFLARHPLAPAGDGQGVLACLYELQEMLKDITGMRAVSLTPAADRQLSLARVIAKGIIVLSAGTWFCSSHFPATRRVYFSDLLGDNARCNRRRSAPLRVSLPQVYPHLP